MQDPDSTSYYNMSEVRLLLQNNCTLCEVGSKVITKKVF